jgi:uncharacterized membrane protein
MSQQSGSAIDSNDKIWAALGYLFFPVAIIMLLMEEQKNKPFIKYHAVQALAVNVALWVVIIALSICSTILAVVTLGIGSICYCLIFLLWLVLLWPAIDSFQGNYTVLPFITDFIKGQKWV